MQLQQKNDKLSFMSDSKHLDAWSTFLKSFNSIHQWMQQEMKHADLPSLEVYDVLWTLEQSPEHALRFSDLGERVILDRYNVTRLADKLEEQGLIQRKRCPKDRRGVYAALTAKGLETRKEMWKTYKKLIQDGFSGKLTQTDHADLMRILKKVWQEPEHKKETPDCDKD